MAAGPKFIRFFWPPKYDSPKTPLRRWGLGGLGAGVGLLLGALLVWIRDGHGSEFFWAFALTGLMQVAVGIALVVRSQTASDAHHTSADPLADGT